MTDHDTTLDRFVDDSPETRSETVESASRDSVTLFRLSADPFVNAGVAGLVGGLSDRVTVDPTRIDCPAADVAGLVDDIRGLVADALTNTHRRTSIAHSINHALDTAGVDDTDARRVPPPDGPFPEDHTIYPDDEIDPDRLVEHDIPQTVAIEEYTESQGLYVQSEEYVGTNSSRYFPNQRAAAEQYLDSFAAVLTSRDEREGFNTCQICGRSDVPSYKDPESGEKVTYNQTFAPLASSSAVVTSLGSGGRTTKHSGRCVACLVAGFYFAIMPKAVRQTGSDDNDARVFVPLGGFDRLVPAMRDVRAVRDEGGLDTPVGDESVRRRTVGNLNTRAVAMQALDLYEVFLRRVDPAVIGEGLLAETVPRPTALQTIVSQTGQSRTIGSLDRVDPDDDIYDRVAPGQHELNDGTHREYWPVNDVLRWYAEFGDAEAQRSETEQLAEGIVHADLQRLEGGVFGFTRAQFREDGRFPDYAQPHPADLTHYFTRVMTQATLDTIDEEDIGAIRRVASGIGSVFHDGDDISVLIGLQNASTQAEFLRSFERASMQAHKESTENPPAKYDAARDDDVEAVLELISDDDTFESAKRMFVIHAALAAQYENATGSDGDDETEAEV